MIIKPLYEEQIGQLTEFLLNVEGEKRSKDFWHQRFEMWWNQNPIFSSKDIRGWIIQKDNNIVGFFGLIPLHFQLEKKTIKTFAGTTWVVNQDFRNMSINVLLKLMQTAKNSILFMTTANKKAEKIYKALGYEPIIEQEQLAYSFVITNSFNYLKLRWGWNILGHGFMYIMHTIYKLINHQNLIGNNQNVRLLDYADKSFDDLWDRTKHYSKYTNIRTKEIINWYCFNSKYFKKVLIGYYHNDILYGYAILMPKISKLKELELVDIWCDHNIEDCFEELIYFSILYANEEKFDRLLLPHWSSKIKNKIKNIKMFKSKPINARKYYKFFTKKKLKLKIKNSYLVGLQGDYGL